MKYLQLVLICLFLFATENTYCQNNEVNIETTKLSNNVYMLVGQGGNIGVSAGDDGVFIIDDQFARLTPKIIEAIKAISDKPFQFLVNTHYHGDHTGGNENMTKQGVKIIAHENVRKRLIDGESSKEALPIITFNDRVNVHMNGEDVKVYHVEHAHTDGDALLYFTKSNVLHTGDTYFKSRYPFIDLKSGGSIDGYINAVKKGLSLVNDNTKIIPGHGAVSNKAEYASFLVMLENLKANVQAEIDKGKTEDEVAANGAITKQYDDLDYGSGFINSERIRRTIYQSLKH
ncbi:MAG: MBL fold metallo-hydrolase [Flavobacteriaceae bacterium]|nr:MBL fold metallo-hydrolase [Flavobacteriaceae bacterium]